MRSIHGIFETLHSLLGRFKKCYKALKQPKLMRGGGLQVVFAVIAPGNTVANLAAGAIAEAGAQQAGDMMQVKPN